MITPEPQKPSVLFVLHLPPPIHGAAMVGNYIKSSHLINSRFKSQYVNLATNIDLNQSGQSSVKKIFTFLRIVKNILKVLNQERFDLCYLTLTASGAGFYKDFLIVLILKLYGNKIIFHFHNKGVSQASDTNVTRLLYSIVFRNTKSILLSSFLYPDISSFVKEKDVLYCPNGIPINPNIREKTKNNNLQSCKLLFLSNMIIEKGVYVLLNAVKELKNRDLSFECHFVGAWAEITEEEFKHIIGKNGLEEIVFAHGPKYGNEKESFFISADAFVFPTFYHYEAFPLVNLEAMQYSLPIVSTYEGGIPEMVVNGETGYLVHQRDANQLANKLELLIRSPELRFKMGIAGKKRFEAYFTLEKFETRFIDVITRAVHV